MRKSISFALTYFALLFLILLDAIYFHLLPLKFFSKYQGKLFGTRMYEKSSLFFTVTNGANFWLRYHLIVYFLWSPIGWIFCSLITRNPENYNLRYVFTASIILPPLTWSYVLFTERYQYVSLIDPISFSVILAIFVTFISVQLFAFVSFREIIAPKYLQNLHVSVKWILLVISCLGILLLHIFYQSFGWAG